MPKCKCCDGKGTHLMGAVVGAECLDSEELDCRECNGEGQTEEEEEEENE